jgi:hypothetical protein
MRFFRVIVASASLISSFVNAQNNPLAILSPLGGSYAAGAPLYVTWAPTEAATITLTLRYGSNTGNLATGDPIAGKCFLSTSDEVYTNSIEDGVPNTGNYTWNIPLTLASFNYAIQITDSNEVTNYSPVFGITGGEGALSTASTQAPTTTTVPSAIATPSTSADKSTSTPSTSATSATSAALVSSSTTHTTAAATTTGSGNSTTHSGGKRVVADGAFAAVLGLGALVIMT